MSSNSVSLAGPYTSKPQIQRIAQTLSLESMDDVEKLSETSFERSYQACQRGEWNLIEPIVDDLSHLVDSTGRTLLMKAAMQQNDAVFRGLAERSVGLTTTDVYGKTILHYLSQNAAGLSSNGYSDLIKKKLGSQYSQTTLASLIQETKKLREQSMMEHIVLQSIEKGISNPHESIQFLKAQIDRYRNAFEYHHPAILNCMRLLEKLQRTVGSPEADATKESYQKWFSVLHGFAPAPLNALNGQELMRQVQLGQDAEVDTFLESCKTRFILTPYDAEKFLSLLNEFSGEYFKKGMVERAVRVIDTLFLAPEAFLADDKEFFAGANLLAGTYYGRLPDNKGSKIAEEYFNKVVELCNDSFPGRDQTLMECYHAMATLYSSFGKLAVAEEFSRKAVVLGLTGIHKDDPYFLDGALDGLTHILVLQRKYEEALQFAEISHVLCLDRRIESHPKERSIYSTALVSLTNILSALKRYDEALEYGKESVSLAETHRETNIVSLTSAHLALANVYKDKNDYKKAHDQYLKAYRHSENNLQARAIAALGLGHCLSSENKCADSLRFFEEASECSAKLQQLLPHDDWQITSFDRMAPPYVLWEATLLGVNRQKDALVVSDKRRARELTNTLAKRFQDPSAAADLTLEQIYDVAQQQNTILVCYSILDYNKSGNNCWVVTPNRTVHTVPINIEKVYDIKFKSSTPPAQSRGQDFPDDLSDDSDEGGTSARGGGEGSRLQETEKEKFLREKQEKRKKKINAWTSEADIANLKVCYLELIQPIEKLLSESPSQTVTFIPDSRLAALPFAIFKHPDTGRYFVEDRACLVAPSIKTLSLLGKLKEQRKKLEVSNESVIVGNPQLTAGSGFINLDLAEKEGISVRNILGAQEDQLMRGKNATISRVLPLMKKARWIHFACHGTPAKNNGPHSEYIGSLHLSPDSEHPDGQLYADDIAKMNLNAELAFLSACHSGKGNAAYLHEGLVGLSRALASSGVLTSASSYWQLPEEPETVDMIETFYNEIIKNQRGKADALRIAMIKAIEKNRDDPLKWGGLFLTGLN